MGRSRITAGWAAGCAIACAVALVGGALATPFAASAATAPARAAATPTVSTVFGDGYYAFCGVRAPKQTCMQPTGVAVGPDGSTFISDATNDLVWRLHHGALSIYAGAIEKTGKCADGSSALGACLNEPSGLAVDAAGNLYVAEMRGHRVDRIDLSGHISRVAGGHRSPGDHFCGDGGPAVDACLGTPEGLLLTPAGDLLIADGLENRVRRVDGAGTITTFAGNGRRGSCGSGGTAIAACVNQPDALAQDRAGNTYIAEFGSDRVAGVDAGGTFETVAGNGTDGFCGEGGPALSACLEGPSGVAVDKSGALFISSQYRVQRVDPTTGDIATVAGNGRPADCADGPAPTDLCLSPGQLLSRPDGRLLIADYWRLRVLDGSTIETLAGSGSGCGDGGPAAQACGGPTDVAVGPDNSLYFSDGYSSIREITRGIVRTVVGGASYGPGCDADGTPALDLCPIIEPFGIAVDSHGTIYFSDGDDIRKVDGSGLVSTVVSTGFAPSDMTIDATDHLVFTSNATQRTVDRVGDDGTVSVIAGGGNGPGCDQSGVPALQACFTHDLGYVARAGDGLDIGPGFFGDTLVHQLSGGVVTTIVDGGSGPHCASEPRLAVQACLSSPQGIAVTPRGVTYLADAGTNAVHVVNRSGHIRTYAGNGTTGFCGDGGPAIDACFDRVWQIAVDSHGGLYLADGGNLRIRKVSA